MTEDYYNAVLQASNDLADLIDDAPEEGEEDSGFRAALGEVAARLTALAQEK